MANPQLPVRFDGPTLFLVERYLPLSVAENLPASVARTARLCALSAGTEPWGDTAGHVEYLHCTYLPTESTCFCLFRAQSADAVRALNEEADFTLDRITAAMLLHPDQAPTDALVVAET